MLKKLAEFQVIQKTVRSLVIILTFGLMIGCQSGSSSNDGTVSPPPATPPPPPPVSNLETQLQSILDNAVSQSNTPGAVMYIYQNDKTYIIASGVADTQTGRQLITTDTFRIASSTKTLVATTVLKLVEENTLSLDALITSHLSTDITDNIPFADQITIRQLLNMTSGVYNYTDSNAFDDAVDADPTRQWTQAELLAFIYNEQADFAPGTSWGYSNSNYVLLDLIVAAASNASLASEMRRVIHTPLQLNSIFMENQEPNITGTSLTTRGYAGVEDVTSTNDGIGFGDGGIITKASDLGLFIQGLFEDKQLLSDSSLSLMRDFHAEEDYGLGLESRTSSFGELWGHSGSSSGYQGDMVYVKDHKITFVLLTNQFDTDIIESVFQSSLTLLTAAQ